MCRQCTCKTGSEVKLFGRPNGEAVSSFKKNYGHKDNFSAALLDEAALWDATVLQEIIENFPDGHIDKADLFLVLSECVANSALHGRAQAVGLYARRRKKVFMLSFFQHPAMDKKLISVVYLAKKGCLPENILDATGGLGFPIMAKLANKITLSHDRTRLRLWFRKDTV